jgi:hypothetical protein
MFLFQQRFKALKYFYLKKNLGLWAFVPVATVVPRPLAIFFTQAQKLKHRKKGFTAKRGSL